MISQCTVLFDVYVGNETDVALRILDYDEQKDIE